MDEDDLVVELPILDFFPELQGNVITNPESVSAGKGRTRC